MRNYLLLGLDALTQDELYKKYWLHIEKTIPGQISNYIRDFMQWHTRSPFKKATEANYKELYRTFKGIFVGLQSRNHPGTAWQNMPIFIVGSSRVGKRAAMRLTMN